VTRRSNRSMRLVDRAARHEHTDVTEIELYRPHDPELRAAQTAVEVPEDVVGDDGHLPTPVDLPDEYVPPGLRTILAAKSAERRPILPGWVTDRDELRYALRWLVGHVAHSTAYHAVRSPRYALRLVGRVPLGAGRLAADAARWIGDAEGMPLRQGAVLRNDPEMYQKLCQQKLERTRWRSILLLGGFLVALLAAGLLTLAPLWCRWVAFLAVTAGLVWRGSRGTRPLLDRAVVPHRVVKLTSEHIIRALGSLGLAGITRALAPGGGGISFPAPITRDGPGWRAEVDLPYGVTALDIIERRERLASGLRRPLGCVWPEPVHDAHTGRLVLWVGQEDMNKSRQAPWPLLKSGTADVFKPIPFGTDQRGRPIAVTLMFDNVLIGAMPRQGKTFAVRDLLLALALDVNVQLRVYELKGTGDLAPFEKVAHEYGISPQDKTIAAVVESLHQLLYEELPRRTDTIARLPRDLAPENKVTPDLAAKSSLGLAPIVLAIDECQEVFSHPTYGGPAKDMALRLIKLGPAVGIILILSTQRPDRDSLPTGVSAQVGIRFCLRVMGQLENDMVLGTSRYKNGNRATMFTQRDKGIGWLVGASDDPQIVRTYYIDALAADKVCDRARALRLSGDGLTGHAAGQPTTDRVDAGGGYSLLEDVAAVMGDEEKLWSEIIVERLSKLRPDVYAGWTVRQLGPALKPHGIETRQVWGQIEGQRGANRYGIVREDLMRQLSEARRKELPPADDV
jgi:S-DNA-T family DNA segregation ATPase FtsK/SpoIIIE